MMRFELGLEKPDPKRAVVSAGTIAGAYIAGGFVPLGPYLFLPTASTALTISVITTLIALAIFGYFTGAPPLRSASPTVLIGGLAAAASIHNSASHFVRAGPTSADMESLVSTIRTRLVMPYKKPNLLSAKGDIARVSD